MGWDVGQDKALNAIRGAYSRGFRDFTFIEQFATPLTIRLSNVVGDKEVVPIGPHDLDMFIDAGFLYTTSPRGSFRTGKVLDSILNFEHVRLGERLPDVHVSNNSGIVNVGHGNHISLTIEQRSAFESLRAELIEAMAREIVSQEVRAEIADSLNDALAEAQSQNKTWRRAKAFIESAQRAAAPYVDTLAKLGQISTTLRTWFGNGEHH